MFVKVTRMTERVIRDEVIVEVAPLPGSSPAAIENAAMELVKAQMASGQKVDWRLMASEPKIYPQPRYSADICHESYAEILDFHQEKKP